MFKSWRSATGKSCLPCPSYRTPSYVLPMPLLFDMLKCSVTTASEHTPAASGRPPSPSAPGPGAVAEGKEGESCCSGARCRACGVGKAA